MKNSQSENVEKFLGVDDLCRILQLKKSYVYLLTHEKKIPHYKINGHLRFRISDIEEWLKNRFIGAEENVKNIEF